MAQEFRQLPRTIHASHTGGLEYTELVPSDTNSWASGGTAHILPAERAKATFDTEKLTNYLDGGKKQTVRRRTFIVGSLSGPYPDGFREKYRMSRHELMRSHFRDFIDIHKEHTANGFIPKKEDVAWMSANSVNSGSLMPHMSLFAMTLMGQGSIEQVAAWYPKAMKFEIIGGYAQTELGHGSNVRGLQTTAHYDKATEEFVLNTNTLQGMKWWNSNIGCSATHCTLYAQLIIDGREYGIHVFFVQLRDENHHCLPGIECGDVGTKLGDNAIDTGYMRLKDVRIPRTHLLSKRQVVEPDGTYVKKSSGADSNDTVAQRMSYLTMMGARSGMALGAASALQRSITTAVRYSCVRHQGFKGGQSGYQAAENAVIDYQMQAFRLYKWLSTAYACTFTGKAVAQQMSEVREKLSKGDQDVGDELAEMHATSAGMKALCCMVCSEGMEDCRKLLGGHGYLLNSGVAADVGDYIWKVTAEGDPIVMYLQAARFLLKCGQAASKGETTRLKGLVEYLKPLARPNLKVKDLKPAMTSDSSLMDLNYLEELYKFRACVSVMQATKQFNNLMSTEAMTFEEAFNKSAVSLITMAKSHGYLDIVKKFRVQVERLEEYDAAIAAVMRQLATFFALTNILEGQQWAGLVSFEDLSLAERAVVDLCGALRPNAVALVDAFDFPDRVLNSDLGRYDGNVYEAFYDFARSSELNSSETFEGYAEFLRPHLDLEFLRKRSCL